MKRQIRLAITALVLVICLVARTRADVLEQVPEDALVVVKVSNLQSLSNKLSKFAEDIGLAQAAPQFSNPLNALQEHAGIKEGLTRAIMGIERMDEKFTEERSSTRDTLNDHEARLRVLEASNSKTGGARTAADWLYHAIIPLASLALGLVVYLSK